MLQNLIIFFPSIFMGCGLENNTESQTENYFSERESLVQETDS